MELRQEKILSLLNNNGGLIKIIDISKILKVSEMTIRRDLIALEEKGILERIHGGVILKKKDEITLGHL